jgi:hypothetical protein
MEFIGRLGREIALRLQPPSPGIIHIQANRDVAYMRGINRPKTFIYPLQIPLSSDWVDQISNSIHYHITSVRDEIGASIPWNPRFDPNIDSAPFPTLLITPSFNSLMPLRILLQE